MKRKLKTILTLTVAGGITLVSMACNKPTLNDVFNKPSTSETAGEWQIVFSDLFNENSNLNKWDIANRLDYNSNICKYDPSIPKIENQDGKSVLSITATKIGNNSYKSGFLNTNFTFTPGLNQEYCTTANIKFSAKEGVNTRSFNQTYGAWPAFWTSQGNGWPTYGEIDILEAYTFGGSAKFASNLFYGTVINTPELGTSCERDLGSISEGWHKYEQYWRNKNGVVTITIKIDDVTKVTYNNSSSSPQNAGKLKLENFSKHNVVLNLNVGHTPPKPTDYRIFGDNTQINLFTQTMMWVDDVIVKKRNI